MKSNRYFVLAIALATVLCAGCDLQSVPPIEDGARAQAAQQAAAVAEAALNASAQAASMR
jgi:hypothetical protein